MAVINPNPIVRCDNCGDEEELTPSSKPNGWGGISIVVHATEHPDNTQNFTDLCPKCMKLVATGIKDILQVGRGGVAKPPKLNVVLDTDESSDSLIVNRSFYQEDGTLFVGVYKRGNS